MTTLLNPNLDSSGYSDDNFLQHELDMGSSLALVRNSPKLVAMNADSRVNIASIYRAAGDGDFSTPEFRFVMDRINAAPQATYIHLTNEAGLPPDIGRWSLGCASVAEFHGKKVVAFNAATNTDVALWKAQESVIRQLVGRGHKIGVHLYLDGSHDAGGYAPLDWLKSIGADCFITEYGYIQSITNDGIGHRAVMDGAQYADWLEAHAAKLASYGWAAFCFSLDQWRNDEQGRAQGFGYEDRPKVIARCKALNQRYLMSQPPTYPPGSNPSPKRVAVPAGLNLRSTPSGTILHVMPFHETVTVYAQPRIVSGGHVWVRVTDADGTQGWSADDQGINGGTSFSDVEAHTFTFHAPFAQYKIVSRFNDPRPGYTTDYPGKKPLHEGTDFEPADGVSCDAVVHIGAACTVTQIGDQSPVGYGRFILVDFGNGFTAIYAHFAEIYVKAGQVLIDRQIVGLQGMSGSASEPHCHITLSNQNIGLDGYVYPKCLDCEPYLAK